MKSHFRYFEFSISSILWERSSVYFCYLNRIPSRVNKKPLKMLKILTQRRCSLSRGLASDSLKRFFLSNAYKCEEAWENRLKNPVFEKIRLENMYHHLDINLAQMKQRVNVIDIDIFATKIADVNYKQELEDLLLRLRRFPECILLPERATHAAIRFFLEHTEKDDLLSVLSDRLNYGLFPDYYLNNLMMDKFLKDKDAVSAVKIAVLQMLQEDFDHPITKSLALYSCYSYLSSSDIWESYKEPEPDPDEEVVPVRVYLVRNPHFDDHFDITDTNHFVGKTLWFIGRSLPDPMGSSSQLVGLVLYEKFDKCCELLEKVLKNKTKLYEGAVNMAREYTLKKPKQVEEVKSEKDGEEEAKAEGGDALEEKKAKVLELLGKIEKENLVKGNVLEDSEKLVRKEVKENEGKDIEVQCQMYKQWEEDRERDMKEEIHKVEMEKLEEEITKVKEELEEEEEKLFFFDREEEFQLKALEKEESKKKVRFYKGKFEKNSDEEYIPPVVEPQRNK